MLLSWVTPFLAAICCAFAGSEDGQFPSPSQRRAVDSVLRKVIAGPLGDTTVITVDGNVEWKETITVNKKTKTLQEEIQDLHFEGCCTMPSNLTFNDTLMDCIVEVKQTFPEEADDDETTKARRRLRDVNCITQCVTYRLGLSDKDGSIISEETVSFILSGNRTVALGISEDMINSCIDTAKATTSETPQSDQAAGTCNTSSLEVFKFAKCMTELENLYCPAEYLRHSKYCDRSRQRMKNEMRHRAEEKKSYY